MSAIEASPDQTTEDYLLAQGFSRAFIDQFFSQLLRRYFSESALHTSARQFEFTFKHFSQGCANLPEAGAIPQQLLQQLRPNSVHLNQSVCAVSPHQVSLAGATVCRPRLSFSPLKGMQSLSYYLDTAAQFNTEPCLHTVLCSSQFTHQGTYYILKWAAATSHQQSMRRQ